jgi:hypothetical protein
MKKKQDFYGDNLMDHAIDAQRYTNDRVSKWLEYRQFYGVPKRTWLDKLRSNIRWRINGIRFWIGSKIIGNEDLYD